MASARNNCEPNTNSCSHRCHSGCVTTSLTPQNVAVKKRRIEDVDLLTRTSWTDAGVAYAQIIKGKANGSRVAVWLRSRLQRQLFTVGCSVHRHAGKVLFVAILLLACFSVALKSAIVETRVDRLWVEEGGRLQRELEYTRQTLGEGSGSTHEVVLQTPIRPGANVLRPDALLAHLRALQEATSVTAELYDITWRLKDLCYAPSVPDFDTHFIDQIFESIIPCAIVTPLDCFWEGSKLLGPEFPVTIPNVGSGVLWTNLNPAALVEKMKKEYQTTVFPFHTMEHFMKRAGISSAYQTKPCLDPSDIQCPDSAPNKISKTIPDIGSSLTGGCYGFATKFMHWPEDLIVGGAKRNRTGHIVRAHALQSVVQLMGARELHHFFVDTYKVHNLDWSVEKAQEVLTQWQLKFMQKVSNTQHPPDYDIHSFSTDSLEGILREFSHSSVTRLALGYILMVVYAGVSLLSWRDCISSQMGVGVGGVLLVGFTVTAGLGFCALLGLSFNAATTQILPFLALGLGVNDIFLIAHSYADTTTLSSVPLSDYTGRILQRTGTSILLTSISNTCALLCAAIIPIPALRAFALQAAILCAFNTSSVLLVFPALVSIDLKRRDAKLMDVFCCLRATPQPLEVDSNKSVKWHQVVPVNTIAMETQPNQVVTVVADDVEKGQFPINSLPVASCSGCPSSKISLVWFVREHFAPLVVTSQCKAISALLYVVIAAGSLWGITKIEDGLHLPDLVPQGSNEHSFLKAQGQFFGFYNMFAVTQGSFEYPPNQKMLYDFHDAFMRVSSVVKNDDGGLPPFWLSLFRDWLLGLQESFDRDVSLGCVNEERWFPNASADGILAYKLLVQTGRVDNPVDRSQLSHGRLVDERGIITPRAFYNYLSAWASNDALAYSTSQASLRPEPRQWFHVPSDVELKIPKSAPLLYAQMPFHLRGLTTTEEITHVIEEVRSICRRFEDRGLPSFPSGVPFTFWEQYIRLRGYLAIALATVAVAVFVVVSLALLNVWAGLLVSLLLAGEVLQLMGAMGVMGIRLSAVPAVTLVVAVGVGGDFAIHILMGFMTSIGGRTRRAQMAVDQMAPPIIRGGLSILLALSTLAFAEVDFIVKYFFGVLSSLVVLALLNALVFFPVALALIGPEAEVIPCGGNGERISTPSPEPSPHRERAPRVVRGPRTQRRGCPQKVNTTANKPSRAPSDLSLTTITEESPSYHSSHEIVVLPEVVVETTPPLYSVTPTSSITTTKVTTKVTATTKVKVEVMPVECDRHCERHSFSSTSRGTSESEGDEEQRT